MIRLIRGLLGRTNIPPAGQRALHGVYDWRLGRLTGWVTDPDGPTNAPLSIAASRKRQGGNESIADVTLRPKHPDARTDFVLETGDAITAEDLLKESIEVLAKNADGTTGLLRLDGAKQVQLIKQNMSPPHEVVVDVDFTRGGNGHLFATRHFSDPGENLTWALGTESEIRLPAPSGDGHYVLRMLVEPFLSKVNPGQLLITVTGASEPPSGTGW